ncbi:hypothetical protein AB4Z19_08195 [Pseudoduganella sp. RAF19]|uniref:hypothetical protein n=1 Tax=Pseudoduganella sp. RAF19 TaxID=3233052 RepID=UPI003F99DC2C
MIANEVRMRLRRLSTLMVLLAVAVVCWSMIADPNSGQALIVVGHQRMLYTSETLAFGTGVLGSLTLSMASFYLVRGRTTQDLRTGMAGVIGASAIGNARLLFSRWAGGVAYLLLLLLAVLGSSIVLHLVRGEGPLMLSVYLESYFLMLMPAILFGASCAVLFDSIGWLMGRAGDVLYFFGWIGLIAVASQLDRGNAMKLPMLFDFTGISVLMVSMRDLMNTADLSIGNSGFDASLAPLVLPPGIWTMQAWIIRVGSMLTAMLPLIPAALVFHRYAPERVRVSAGSKRRSPLAMVDGWLKPVARLLHPVALLSLRAPGLAGDVLGELVLALRSAPSALVALVGIGAAAPFVAHSALPGVMVAGVACWGILVSGIAPRDAEAGMEALSLATPGGISRRYLRQWSTCVLLALPFALPVALRWVDAEPVRALAVLVGVLALSVAAVAMGSMARTGRLFLALFLFALFVAANATNIPALDFIGFNGVATVESIANLAKAGVVLLAAAYAWSRRTV